MGTHESVACAADRLLDAVGARADADDGDRGALDADGDVNAPKNHAEQAEEDRRDGVAGLQFQTTSSVSLGSMRIRRWH